MTGMQHEPYHETVSSEHRERQRVEIVDCVLLWPSLASPAGKLDALYA